MSIHKNLINPFPNYYFYTVTSLWLLIFDFLLPFLLLILLLQLQRKLPNILLRNSPIILFHLDKRSPHQQSIRSHKYPSHHSKLFHRPFCIKLPHQKRTKTEQTGIQKILSCLPYELLLFCLVFL